MKNYNENDKYDLNVDGNKIENNDVIKEYSSYQDDLGGKNYKTNRNINVNIKNFFRVIIGVFIIVCIYYFLSYLAIEKVINDLGVNSNENNIVKNNNTIIQEEFVEEIEEEIWGNPEVKKIKTYESNCKIKELFVDKEFRTIYLELENKNLNEGHIYIDIAFYDKDGKLVDVMEYPASNAQANKKVIEEIRYEKNYYTYDVIARVHYINEKETEKSVVDLEVASTNEYSNIGKINYTIKNNSEEPVGGYLYIIFYDENDNIIKIESDYVSKVLSGEVSAETIYVDSNLDYSYFTFNTNGVEIK